MRKTDAAIAALCMISAASHAEGLAVSAHASPEGGGVEVTRQLSEKFNARVAYHEYSFHGTDAVAFLGQLVNFWPDLLGATKSDIAYDHNGNQQVMSVLADWYPSEEGQSRISVGLGYNSSNDSIIGNELITGGYTINGKHYTAAEVGKVQGSIKYSSLAPYIGFGWGNPVAKNKSWGFVADVGLLYQGKPKVTLTATGTALGLQTDIAGEQTRIERHSYAWSPVLAVGMSYQW